MSDDETKAATRVVTLNTLASAGAVAEAPTSEVDTVERARVLALFAEETAKCGGNVLITFQDGTASRLQSLISEQGKDASPLSAGGVEAQFGDGLGGGDVLGWALSLVDHLPQSKWHPIVRPPDRSVEALPNKARIAVLSDWGTGLYGAPVSASSIAAAGGYDLLLHLGDIYYSGTKSETQSRFLDAWPTAAGAVSRALNGNHEMYSGGFGYFDSILPAFKQSGSYFAFQTDYWLLVGLDTAYVDHDLDAEQVAWLAGVIAAAGTRKVVLFSHHQPFSRLDKQGPNLQVALTRIPRAVTAWYWGHEHVCAIYEPHPTLKLLGRCVGNGGIPSPRNSKVKQAPSERSVAGVSWKRLGATTESPSCVVLDGSNSYVAGEETKFGPHGYVTLEPDGPTLIERIHLPDGTEIYSNVIS